MSFFCLNYLSMTTMTSNVISGLFLCHCVYRKVRIIDLMNTNDIADYN